MLTLLAIKCTLVCILYTDFFSTKLKLTGDMKVSFPAGIVKVLMDNPSPHTLSFRIKNTSTFEHILVNKQLIQQ